MKRRAFLAAAASLTISPLPPVRLGLLQRVVLSSNRTLTFTHASGQWIQLSLVQDTKKAIKYPAAIEWSGKPNV